MIAIHSRSFVLLLCLAACAAPPAPEAAGDEARAPAIETAPSARTVRPPATAPVAEPRPRRVAMVSGLRFDAEPLDEALKRLQLVTGAPILITPKGRSVITDQAVTIELQLTTSLRLESVLDLFVQQSPDLGWKVDDGVIWITTKSDARGPMQLQMYDVRDLLMARPNFPAPRIQGLPTGEESYGYQEEQETTRVMDPDQLIDLIRNATGPDYWEETEGASIEVTDNGVLLVRADSKMQGLIGGTVRQQR